MKTKLIYVTRKQVNDFIRLHQTALKINNDELLKEVKYALFALKKFPNDNKNQIKFYTRVYKELTRGLNTPQ